MWVAAAMYLALSAICLFMHMSDMSRLLAYINFICTVFASNIIESFYVCEHRAPSFFCHLIFVFVSFGFASYATLVLKINEKAYQNCDNVSKFLIFWHESKHCAFLPSFLKSNENPELFEQFKRIDAGLGLLFLRLLEIFMKYITIKYWFNRIRSRIFHFLRNSRVFLCRQFNGAKASVRDRFDISNGKVFTFDLNHCFLLGIVIRERLGEL